MDNPVVLGDTLPELVNTLIETHFAAGDICGFSARSVDYEIFWVEAWPDQALVEPGYEDWSVPLWICFPVKRVNVNGEDIIEASTIKLYPSRHVLEILNKDGVVLETSSPINLISPSPI